LYKKPQGFSAYSLAAGIIPDKRREINKTTKTTRKSRREK